MRLIGNIIWFIFCGLASFLSWSFVGLIFCITIIGIPFGLQCFKIGRASLFPFGKEVVGSGTTGSLLLNILWIICFGWELFLVHLTSAFFLCITIIGIPFAKQAWKLAKVSLAPFGAKVQSISK